MLVIWRTKKITIALWGSVHGLKYKGQRPKFIILSDAEEEELDRAGEKGVSYRKRLKLAVEFKRNV